VGYSLASCAG